MGFGHLLSDVGELDTIVVVRKLIADAMLPMAVADADLIVSAAHAINL